MTGAPQSATVDVPTGVARFARRRPLPLFFVSAYLWSWTIWFAVPHIIRHHGLGWKFDTFDIVLIILGTCGPTIAALATQWLGYRNLKACAVWTGWKPVGVGLTIGLVAFAATTVIVPALVLAQVPPGVLHWTALAHWSVYAVNYSTFLGGPMTEEAGWRGFALPRLQAQFGPTIGTVILAVLWAAWHTPMFLVPGWVTASPWQYCLILIGVSFLLTLAANLARFSIIVAILLHAFFNTSSGLLNGVLKGIPTRPHDSLIYTAIVCGLGVLLGGMAFANPIRRSIVVASSHRY